MTTTAAASALPAVPRRWAALVFIALAQLMVVLDATVVNIALPSAQRALGISAADRQWVITAYTLVFGGLLLFGGRIADLVGRKRTFLIGLIGFAGASALGGAATGEEMLFAARGLQGAFGALLAPSALSLIAVSFTQPRERAKAFGIYGALSGGGGAVGLLLGGAVTEYLGWRWALYVNVPIAAVAFVGALILVHVPPAGGRRRRLDVPGAVLITGGLVALVYGFTRAESEGWRERGVLGLFAAAAVLIILFVVAEAVSRAPLLPLRVVTDRRRGGSYIAVGLAVIAMYGLFLFLTYYLQVVKGYSPVRTGLAFLPFSIGMITGSTQIAARLMHRVPARALMVPGLLLAALGTWLLTHIRVDSSYTHLVLPSEILISLGLGSTMMPATNLATTGVAPHDTGVASAMVNTAQQVGGSIGIALLNTIAATATTRYIDARAHGRPSVPLAAAGQVHGYAIAISWSVGILLLAAVLVAVMVKGRPQTAPGAAPHAVEAARTGTGGPDTRTDRVLALSSAGAPARPEPGAGTASLSARGQHRRAAGAFVAEPAASGNAGRRAWTAGPPYEPADLARPPEPGEPDGAWTVGPPASGDPEPGADGPSASGGQEPWTSGASATDGTRYAAAPAEPYTARGLSGSTAGEPPAGSFVTDVYRSPDHAGAASAEAATAGGETGGASGGGAASSEIRGSVHGAGGVSLPGAMLTLVDPGGRQLGRVMSAEDGSYALAAPGPGTYVLIATGPGYRARAVTVVVGGGPLLHRLTLDGTAGLAGVVSADRDGAPIARAVVVLADTRGEIIASAETDHEGEFAFRDLLPGTLTLAARAPGHRPAAVMVRIDDDTVARCDVRLPAGASLRGTVRAGPQERSLGDARVTLVNAAGDVVAGTITGADGTYAFENLDPGPYTVIASGYAPVASALTLDRSDRSGADITLSQPDDAASASPPPTASGVPESFASGTAGAPGAPAGGTIPAGPEPTGDDENPHR